MTWPYWVAGTVVVVLLGLATFQFVHAPQGAPTVSGTVGSSTEQSANSQQTNAANVATTSQTSMQTPQSSVTIASLPAGEAWETTLPLGDYKYTTNAPEKGYIYVCHVATGGQGAQGNPPWIDEANGTWTLSDKLAVEGSVSWPSAYYSMTVSGAWRTIKSNGLPTDHDTGIFPIQKTDPAYQYDANPNTIEAQNYDYMLPVDPTQLATPDCIYGEVGMMDDGIPLFDGFDAEYRDALAHEILDQWNGHPDQSDIYHNHGFEQGPVKEPVSTVVGFAFDGYPVTGSLLPDGNYLHTADLDECHGITSTITLDGKSVTMYHYVLTQDFPYTVSCFRGQSYEPKPGTSTTSMSGMEMGSQTNTSAGQGTPTEGGQGSQQTPPQAAITACDSKSSSSSCSFSGQSGTISGTCSTPPGQSSLACVPNQ